MPKDYTDFVLMIFGAGDRVVHYVHLRNRTYQPLNGRTYPANGHKYALNLDRAYRIRWAPWPKWNIKKPGWSIKEIFRSKKIGLLLYQEPPPATEIRIVTDCECSCGFKGATMPGTKVHVSKAGGEGHTIKEIVSIELRNIAKEPIEPMHISRIHQPSGVMKG